MSPQRPSAPTAPPDPDDPPHAPDPAGPDDPAGPPVACSPPDTGDLGRPRTRDPDDRPAAPLRAPRSDLLRQARLRGGRRGRSSRRTRRSRRRAEPAQEAQDIPAETRRALTEAGLTLGVPLGRSIGAAAPHRALDARGEHVVVRLLDIPEGDRGAAILRRLAGLRTLCHPGLVPIREVLSLPGQRAAVVMELIDGAGLDVVLGARGRLTTGQLARLLDSLGSALAHMHERGAIHGDISAGNVVVRLNGSPVLVDLLGSFMESGTQDCAAPERMAGGPATAASDVYALAALLHECAGPGGTAARRAARVLGGALAQDPQLRPGARDLAARAPELGRPAPIELPDGARLAAGCLRAAARTPTRTVASRRMRRRGPAVALSYGGTRPGRGGWSGAAPGRWRLRGLGLALLASAGCWLILNPAAPGSILGTWPLSAVVAAGPTEAAPQAPVDSAAAAASAPPPGEPVPDPAPGAPGGGADGAPSGDADGAAGDSSSWAPPSSSAGPQAPAGPGREESSEGRGGDMTAVVVALALARDRALMDADPEALASTTVPDSPAAAADAAVMEDLLASGEGVEGLHTSISGVQEVEVPEQAAATWPGARAVRLTESQGPYTRSGRDGVRTVPAQGSRQVVLVLVPGPWRVAEVHRP